MKQGGRITALSLLFTGFWYLGGRRIWLSRTPREWAEWVTEAD